MYVCEWVRERKENDRIEQSRRKESEMAGDTNRVERERIEKELGEVDKEIDRTTDNCLVDRDVRQRGRRE